MSTSGGLQGVKLFDSEGRELLVQDGVAIPANTPRILIAGAEGSNARTLRTASDGTVRMDPTGTTTQPISAASLPLPAGAATEGTLASIDAAVATEATLATLLTEATGASIDTVLKAIRDTAGIKKITDPLPAGTNEIGAVKQGTKAAGSGAWPQVLYDSSGNEIGVVLDGSVYRLQSESKLRGKVSTVNSSSTPLGASSTFTGVSEEITDFAIVYVTLFADQASATDGLSVEQSLDGTNWDNLDKFTVLANKGKTYSFQAAAKFFRVVYTNGATPQGVFRLQTVFKQVYGKPSTHRIQDSITDEDDAELTKSVLTGIDDAGVFQNVGVTEDGTLRVTSATPVSGLVTGKVLNAGSPDMNVDGSVTQVDFTFDADPTDDLLIQKVTIVFVPNVLRVDSSSFGSFATLTNGVRVSFTSNGVETELGVLKLTEDIIAFGDRRIIETQLSANDLLSVVLDFAGSAKLFGGTSDNLKFEIRDDLTGAGPNSLVHFSASVVATKVS